MVSDGMDRYLRRALSAMVPVPLRDAWGASGMKLRPSSGEDRPQLDVAAGGKTAEVAVAAETCGAGHHALRPDQSNGRLRYGSLLRGSSLPTGYTLDPSDPDVLLLVRPDGTTVALFSARGVTAEGVLEAAGHDHGLRTHEEPLGEP